MRSLVLFCVVLRYDTIARCCGGGRWTVDPGQRRTDTDEAVLPSIQQNLN